MSRNGAAPAPIAGIVLAGGLSSRMGGREKALLPLGGRPLLSRVVERATPQVAALALSANGDPTRLASFGLPVLADSVPGFAGPLAGILAALDWAAAAAAGFDTVASFACDTPFFPADLVARLVAARQREGAVIARAASAGRVHPIFALWPVALREELRRALRHDGPRQVVAWSARHGVATAQFDATPFDPFFNINTPEDLARAEGLLGAAVSADNAQEDGTQNG